MPRVDLVELARGQSTSAPPTTEAIVLAAGNGDRFHNGTRHSKLLTPIAGTPLLVRTLQAARSAGITTAHVVLGYDADTVQSRASSGAPEGLRLHFHRNERWQQENGVSVLSAQPCFDERPFALMMGDHIFDPAVLERLLTTPRRRGESLLAVDRSPGNPAVASEATKVRLADDRVTAIGKSLEPYDALDTGLFVCDPSLFASLAASCESGDSTLSGGVGLLAARGLVRGVDVGGARWCDVDTLDDVALAEDIVAPRSHA
jgi:1L-myo-inositol 1-phosphate cytidylyltransferase